MIDVDAHVLVCHSEKEQAAPTFKHTFGYHPLLAFCDNTGEFLAALLRPGNAGSNTAADHIAVLDAALAQIPDAYRHGHPILVRADGAGCTKAFLAHIRSLRDSGVSCEFSVGWTITGREHAAIALLRERDWTAAVDTDGNPRPVDEAAVAEITGLLPAATLADLPGRHAGDRAPRAPASRRAARPDRTSATATATPRWPPTPAPASTPSSTPATAPTPESRTASAAAATPAWAGCPAAPSRSTPPG